MRIKLFITLLIITIQANGQSEKNRWKDLFSYNNVKYLEEVKGTIYCGTENGIFLFNPQVINEDWIKLNKTNFLNHVGISAMAYDKDSDSFLIGYENGGLDLLRAEQTTMVLDIRWNEFNGLKKINHITIYDDVAFIVGAFGVVSFDLKDLEFRETTRTSFSVNHVAVLNNVIYMATTDGVKYSPLKEKFNNPNINNWASIENGKNISNIESFNNEIYYSIGNNLYSLSGLIATYDETIKTVKSSNGSLLITQANKISILNGNSYSKQSNSFNDAIFVNNKIFAGSVNNGLIDLSATNDTTYKPAGPYSNKSFSVTSVNGKIWIAPEGVENFNNVIFNADGFSYFDSQNWIHYSSELMERAKGIIKIAVDPTNNQHFIAIPYPEVVRWGGKKIGVFEFEPNKSTPTHIIDPLPETYRFGGGSFDNQGNFYLSESWYVDSNGYNDKVNSLAIKKKNNNWIVKQRYNQDRSNALSPVIGDKYIFIPQARAGGVAVLRKDNYDVAGNILRTGEQSLPSDNVWSVALDKLGDLWIGTGDGLAVTHNAEYAVDNNNFSADQIVIEQDGIAEALFTNLGIYAIKVDNSNRKWIATNGNGVYYVTKNGEKTRLHFTTKNSPLPSDTVYDVSIDESTGNVYFATDKGVVSYRGDVSTESHDFNNAILYPNPYRPEHKGYITIKNLPNRAIIKITDIVGNLLFEKKAEGGILEWDTKNFKGKLVASGIYFVLMSNTDGSESKTLKIAIVR